MRRLVVTLTMFFAILGIAAALLLVRQRQEQCAPVPLIGQNMLPNAALVPDAGSRMPAGWASAADGVELRGRAISDNPDEWGFDLDQDGRALQLIGIANEVRTPTIKVTPGQSYCFVARALTDSPKSATRLRAVFAWQDAAGTPMGDHASDWQAVPQWQSPDFRDWAFIRAAGRAPDQAATLQIKLQPTSDDRVYLDAMAVRWTTDNRQPTTDNRQPTTDSPQLQPWPNGARGAVSFTFDWETAMGGLIHTRSNLADDPNYSQDWRERAMRMREGVTTTLDLFRPDGIRATYYATGYNFLQGNAERRQFLGNPTYEWAKPQNGWPNDWSQRPWFGDDPFGTVESDPIWYFGDLVPRLLAEKQDIQTHTFAHFAATYVTPVDWNADFAAFREVVAASGVAAPRSLAFPWSSSTGMSDADWQALADNGIQSVTRTYWAQAKSTLFPRDSNAADGLVTTPRCRPVPGHETILACSDFYLTTRSAPNAPAMIDRAIAQGGMIDLWAHTEEVTSPEQIVAWRAVVDYAVQKREAGELWIAPLSEVADWQQALALVSIQGSEGNQAEDSSLTWTVTNGSGINLQGLTVNMPVKIQRATVDGKEIPILDSETLILNLSAQQGREVVVWPA